MCVNMAMKHSTYIRAEMKCERLKKILWKLVVPKLSFAVQIGVGKARERERER